MPKHKTSKVFDYFVVDASSNTSKCSICGEVKPKAITTNLKNHLQLHHRDKYEEMLAAETARKTVGKLELELCSYDDAQGSFDIY